MCDTYDNQLYKNITRNPHHILHQYYYFRQSPQLQKITILEHANTIGCSSIVHVLRVSDFNFIYRALYSDIY